MAKVIVRRVAIIQTDVCGALAYHPRCMECEWVGKRHDDESIAIRIAKRHVCSYWANHE